MLVARIRPRHAVLWIGALLLLSSSLGAQPAAGDPVGAGLYAAPVQTGGFTYAWDEDRFYRIRTGPIVEEITDAAGDSLGGVRGLIPDPAFQGAVWFWTEDRLFGLLSLTTTASEVTRQSGASLGGIRGVVEANGFWIWTDDALYLRRFGTLAVEVTGPGGASLEALSGVVPTPQGAIAWGRDGVFAANPLVASATPIPAPGGGPIRISFFGGVVTSRGVPRLWNANGAWVVNFGSAQEITDAAGSPLTGARGVVAGGGGLVWLWTGQGVFSHGIGTQATEILHQGASIPGVQGLVAGPPGATWFWTEGRLLAHQVGTASAVEITDPGGGPVRGVEGLVAGGGGTFLWTDDRVLGFQAGGTSTVEVTAPGGGSLAGVRGITTGGGRTVLWTGDGVFGHQPGGTSTLEVTTPRGGPIRNAWVAVPRPGSGDVWIRNHAATYALGLGTTTATEVLDRDGQRIGSPPYNLPLSSVGLTRTAGAGAGAPFSLAAGVTFAGGVSGATGTGTPIPFPLGLSSVVAGGGLQTVGVHLARSTVSADGSAVLATGVLGDFVSLAIAFETDRASVNRSGREGNDRSSSASVSGEGRFVAFDSDATNLIPGDTNGTGDVFVRDRLRGVTRRAAPPGVEPNGGAGFPALSADGRFVSFFSAASNFVPGDTNGQSDVFLWDRETGAVERVSVRSGGGQGQGGGSDSSALSADGSVVAFASRFTNLVPGDTNGTLDVFVRDRTAGTTERVSVSSTGGEADGPSGTPAISAGGRFIAFSSHATNLVPGDTNGSWDVFVHDRLTARTERVSVSSAGTQQAGVPFLPSPAPAISADGRFVAFDSSAANLVPGDTNGALDVFVHDRATGHTERVSLVGRRGEANGTSRAPSLSADGRHVAFLSDAPNLVGSNPPPGSAIFVRDRVAATTRRASHTFLDNALQTELGGFEPALSGDGRFVAFSSAGETRAGGGNGIQDVLVRDLGAPDSVLPWMLHSRGSVDFRSNAFLHNPSDRPLVLDLVYFKRGLPDPSKPVEGLTVGAHETAFLEDLLPELLGVDPGSGSVGIDRVHFYADAEPLATFQVRNPAPGGGSYGLAGSARPVTGGDRAATRVQTLFGLNLTEEKRSFIGVYNVQQDRAVYDLEFFDRRGNPVGQSQRGLVLGPNGHKQFSVQELSLIFELQDVEDFRAEVTTRSGGPVHAFAGTVRTGSGDSIFIPAARPGRPVVHLLGALATAGAQGTRWTTDAVLHNPAGVPVEARLTFTNTGFRSQPVPLGPPVVLAPGETVRLRDLLQGAGLSAAVGVLTVESDGAPGGVYPVVAAEGIETSSPSALYGRYTPALRDAEAASPSERSLLVGLRQNGDYRSTVWLYNPSGVRADLELRYLDPDGHAVATTAHPVGPGKAVQLNPSRHPTEVDGLAAFTLEVEVRSGRVLTAAAVVNNVTGDPSFVAGTTRP